MHPKLLEIFGICSELNGYLDEHITFAEPQLTALKSVLTQTADSLIKMMSRGVDFQTDYELALDAINYLLERINNIDE